MPLAFIALAWLAIMTGIRGDYTQVGQAFSQDVIGSNGQGGFVQFGAGIIGIAVFFRLIGAPNAGKVFLGLVILVFIIQNPNILTALQSIGGASSTASTGTGAVSTTGSAASSSTSAAVGGNTDLANGTVTGANNTVGGIGSA